jgi:hypothetical protein
VLGLLSCLFLLSGLEPVVIGTGVIIAGAGAVIAVSLGKRTKNA